MAELADAIATINNKELDRNEQAIAAEFPAPPPMSQENRVALVPFVEYCQSHKLRPVPAKVCSVASFICWQQDNRVDRQVIHAGLSAITALHASRLVGDPVPQAVSLTTFGGAPIDPPRSWRPDEKQEFMRLPVVVQWTIARRENDRERSLRRGQNEIAEMKKRLQADAETKSATTEGKSK